MKFCKNLQRVVDISDPEWAPYWINYKMLKVRKRPWSLLLFAFVDCRERTEQNGEPVLDVVVP